MMCGKTDDKLVYVSDGDDSDTESVLDDFEVEECNEGETKLGQVSVVVSKQDCKDLRKPWRRALIIKVLGRTVSFCVLQQRLPILWSLSAGCEIIDLEEGYYIVRFYAKGDYEHVLEGGSWLIQGHYLTVKKWRPYFRPENNSINSKIAWVRLAQIPIEFYEEKVLMQIGDRIVKAVKVDATTLRAERGKYACICVEVDLTKPLISVANLNGWIYKVEYEGLHLI